MHSSICALYADDTIMCLGISALHLAINNADAGDSVALLGNNIIWLGVNLSICLVGIMRKKQQIFFEKPNAKIKAILVAQHYQAHCCVITLKFCMKS